MLLLGSFIASAILTALVRRYSLKVGFVSKPVESRYSNKTIALGGGIAIFITLAGIMTDGAIAMKLATSLGMFESLLARLNVNTADFFAKINQLIIVIAVMAVLFILGLWDDKKHLSPFSKLAVQFAAALIAAAFAEIRVEFFIQSRIITIILSAFWIVLLINVFNFLDNMDGASCGIAAITASVLFTAAALNGQVFVGGLALLFIGTMLGFLVFNFPPAKIYMGDAGSFVIGFFLAVLTLKTTYYDQTQSGPWYPVLLPLIAMAVPLYDFATVTGLRIRQGKSPFEGDTQHFSHRLKRHGFSDTQTVLILYLATLTTGLGATFLYQVDLTGAILILVQTFLVLAIIAIFESAAKND